MMLEAPGLEPLSFEWIFGDRLAMMHFYEMNGNLMYDPTIQFLVNSANKTMTAVSFEQSMPQLYKYSGENGLWHSVDGNGNDVELKNLGIEINNFAAQWFENIGRQGFMPVHGSLVLESKTENRLDGEEIRVTFDATGKPIMPEQEIESQKVEKPDFSLPDALTSIAERNEYGYTDDIMLPLSNIRAVELFVANNTIYLLYPDNTEAMAFDRDEIL
jgi:hypothetical protein